MASKDEDSDDEVTRDDEESDATAEESTALEREESDDPEQDEAVDSEAKLEAHQAQELAAEAAQLSHGEEEGVVPQQLGTVRYVHAAFFGAGLVTAFIAYKLLAELWGALADWPTASRSLPFLLRYAEDERGTFTLVAGALIGVLAVVQTYRNEGIRRWADDVAYELSKVTWPTRDTVTTGTVVVIVASMIATVYIALLDRFWGFLTHLVYGA